MACDSFVLLAYVGSKPRLSFLTLRPTGLLESFDTLGARRRAASDPEKAVKSASKLSEVSGCTEVTATSSCGLFCCFRECNDETRKGDSSIVRRFDL